MKLCLSQVTTLDSPFEADVEAYARAGWPAVELWLTKLERFLEGRSPADARGLLDRHGLVAAGAAAQGGLLLSAGEERRAHWDHFRRRLDLLAALGTSSLVLVPDFARAPAEGEVGRALESLAEAAALARAAGLRLALEFPKTSPFCASLDTAAALVAQCGSDALGVCLDVFHYYTGPSKFEDLGLLSAADLAWVQISDLAGTPRELARDSDRVLPGDGDLPLGPILDHLGRIGYDGYVSVEVLNPNLWAIPADRVSEFALRAARRTLGDRLAGPPQPPGGT